MIPPSRKRAPRSFAQAARVRDSAGVEVVRSTRSLPVRSASASASRTEASSRRQATTSGLAATASAAVAATRAPHGGEFGAPAGAAVPDGQGVARGEPGTGERDAHRAEAEQGERGGPGGSRGVVGHAD